MRNTLNLLLALLAGLLCGALYSGWLLVSVLYWAVRFFLLPHSKQGQPFLAPRQA